MATQNITLKLFHQEEIRRVTVPRPSFPQFLQFVHELFPEIKPEVRVTYVDSDGDKVTVSSEVEWTCALDEQKNDKIARFTIESGVARKRPEANQLVHVSYYTEDSNESVSKSKVQYLTGTLRSLLEKYIEGPISPKNVPAWLKPAVKFLPRTNDEFDLDINVAQLWDVLHQRAYSLLGQNLAESTMQAKFILLDCLTLCPENVFGLYNLACAEALLGETSSALNYLKKAIRAGYGNWKHMETDDDLKNLHGTSEFKELLDGLRAKEQTYATVETAQEAEKEKSKQLDAEKVAREQEERKSRALDLIRFAEQRRLKLEEEERERATQAVEQAVKEQEEAMKKKIEAEQQVREQKRQEEEAREATMSQLRMKWASSVQNLSEMGFVMDFDNLQKLDRVQGSVEAFFADS